MSEQRHKQPGIVRVFREARRRRVFRVAGLYIIGAWVILQVADVVFPGLGIPEGAIRALLIAALVGFPIALVFGWMYDLGPTGIRRTASAGESELTRPRPLGRGDYLILSAFILVLAVIIYNVTRAVLEAPTAEAPVTVAAEAEPEPLPTLEDSIAVLPFANLSSDPDDGYFSRGVAEEILNRLGQFEEVTVIGRTSSFAFQDRDLPAPRISALLGCEFLLQGSVRRAGDRVRISTQLLDAQGVQLWTRNFDRELVDVFAIQSEIADAVALTVVPRIVPDSEVAAPPDLVAYEHFLRGRDLLYRRLNDQAQAEFEQAIDLDPDYAEAHAELAVTLLLGLPTADELERAQQAINRAVSLRPGLLRAMEAQGLHFNSRMPPDVESAEALLRDVLARDPDRFDALNWLAGSLFVQGQPEAARAFFERAVRIDPLNPVLVVNWATKLLQRGQARQAEQRVMRLIESPQNVGPYPYQFLRDLYWDTGQLVEMNRIAKRQVLDGAAAHYASLMFNYAALGDPKQALYWGLRTQQDFPDHRASGFWTVSPAQMAGRYEEALERFEQGLEKRERATEELGSYFVFWEGRLLVLAGHFDHAREVLAPVAEQLVSHGEVETALALAWAYRETGDAEAAGELIQRLRASTPLNLYEQAVAAMLEDDLEAALDLLQSAIDAGWRDYYPRHHDPRWDPVRDHPRFMAMMAEVRADVDEQRAVVEAMDADGDFIEQLDEKRAEAGDY